MTSTSLHAFEYLCRETNVIYCHVPWKFHFLENDDEMQILWKTQFFVLSVTLKNNVICLSCYTCITSDRVRENFSAGTFKSGSIQHLQCSLSFSLASENSTAYLIKAHSKRHAYNRINCFWCVRALALVSAWIRDSYPSFVHFSISACFS